MARRQGTNRDRAPGGQQKPGSRGQGPRGQQRPGGRGQDLRRQGTGPQWAGYKTPRDSSERLQFRKDLFTLKDLVACWFVAAWLLPTLPLGLSSL